MEDTVNEGQVCRAREEDLDIIRGEENIHSIVEGLYKDNYPLWYKQHLKIKKTANDHGAKLWVASEVSIAEAREGERMMLGWIRSAKSSICFIAGPLNILLFTDKVMKALAKRVGGDPNFTVLIIGKMPIMVADNLGDLYDSPFYRCIHKGALTQRYPNCKVCYKKTVGNMFLVIIDEKKVFYQLPHNEFTAIRTNIEIKLQKKNGVQPQVKEIGRKLRKVFFGNIDKLKPFTVEKLNEVGSRKTVTQFKRAQASKVKTLFDISCTC
jgi:hypothetical protein